MFGIFPTLCIFLLDVFSVGSDEVSVSVIEGDSVTLYTGVQTNQQTRIRWYFNGTRIAQINGDQSKTCTDVQCNEDTERFRDRLKLDHHTGSLTIMNITNTHSGEYQLHISNNSSSSDSIKSFIFSVSEIAAEMNELKSMSPKERESVTLDPAVVRKSNDGMTWYFNDIVIAEITGDQSKICTDDQCKERFRDRLKLDHQTGSLTITNTRNTDSGEYTLLINSSSDIIPRHQLGISSIRRFSVTVTDSGLSSGAVAGIVVCVVLLVSAAVIAAVIYRRRNRHAPIPRNHNGNQELQMN